MPRPWSCVVFGILLLLAPPPCTSTRGIRQQDTSSKLLRSVADLVPPEYPLEQHSVTTRDGYILALLRIPFSPSSRGPSLKTGRGSQQPRPVLLQHGLLDSCAGFLLQGPGAALAFLLADAGYDVWMANSRGSSNSRTHAWLPTTSSEYWRFSYDEMAQYDLPGTLDYIIKATGQPRVSFVSHSQGGTILLAALASQPALVDKLGLMVLMAPVATARHVTSIPMQTLATLGTDAIFSLLGIHEFMPSVKVLSWMEGRLCIVRPDLCVSILAAICGYREGAVNMTRLPLYLQYTPAGTSVQNMAHWSQSIRGGSSPGRPQLTYFDYGTTCSEWGRQHTCNQEQYGSLEPPVYQLSSIPSTARMVIFTGGQDRLADPLDVELLLESLPAGVVVSHQYDPDLEHLDYIWGADAADRIYSKVLAALSGHLSEAQAS